uniref:Uncharacterized protein n=1 Tax=viral metagenome TaxID=1070528 RepID=A0A6M3KML9_9ZZZZ
MVVDPALKKYIVIASEVPSLPINWEDDIVWLKPDGLFYTWNGNVWEAVTDTVTAPELVAALSALASIYAAINHTHPNLDQLADIVTLLNSGVTGTKTIAGHQVTFNHGVLVGYQAP